MANERVSRVFYDSKNTTIQIVFRTGYKSLDTFNFDLSKFLTTREIFKILFKKIFNLGTEVAEQQ